MEARLKPIIFINVLDPFQSTRPRGRDCEPQRATHAREISIHAPRMGRDSIISTSTACGTHFNPRAHTGRDKP